MRRFLKDLQLKQMEWPEGFGEFSDLLTTSDVGTVGETSRCDSDDVICFPPIKRISLDTDDVNELSEIYTVMHGNVEKVLRISEAFKAIQVNGRVIKSSYNTGIFVETGNSPKPAKIVRFIKNECIITKDSKRKKVENSMVEVDFFKEHPQKNWYPDPFQVWSSDIDYNSFVPLSSIVGQFMRFTYRIKFTYGVETVQIVIPLIGRFH